MPNYQGHLLGGFVTFGLTLALVQKVSTKHFTNPIEIMLCLFVCLLGSLFPDIDIKSKGQRIFYEVLFCGMLFAILFKQWNLVIALSIASLIPLMTKHRGTIHTVWFIIGAPLFIPYTVSAYKPELSQTAILIYIFFVSGAFSHLLLDFGPKKLLFRTLGLEKSKKSQKRR